MKLEATCMSIAKRAQSKAGVHCATPLAYASAVATATGINAADSVFGRAARNQALRGDIIYSI